MPGAWGCISRAYGESMSFFHRGGIAAIVRCVILASILICYEFGMHSWNSNSSKSGKE